MGLQTGFSFIGIFEYWNLSICLFNTMFNQRCRFMQFSNNHPTQGNTSSVYDTAILKGWRDPYDNELYNLAVKIFEASLNTYKVSNSSCQACWHEAGLF